MYLDYFGFSEEPFNLTPNSRFLFMSERHREALAALLYGIEQRKGFIALTGEIGCGKTTICRAMLGRLDRDKIKLALVLNPELSDIELLQTICGEFGLPATSTSKRELLDGLNRHLLAEYTAERNSVLLIDEAQRLSPEALEQVRLLGNLETENAKLLQIALVGQPELGDMLDLPELEQLNQRITVRYHIGPLTFEELSDYIDHRLTVAQPKVAVRFNKKALRKIYDYSQGTPRRVNVLCDRALLVTYAKGQQEVGEDAVTKAIEELGGMPKRHAKRAKVAALSSNAGASSETQQLPAAAIVTANSGGGNGLVAAGLALGLLAIAGAIYFGRDDAAARTNPTIILPTPVPQSAPIRPTPTPIVVTPIPMEAIAPVASPVPTVASTEAPPVAEPTQDATPSPRPTPEATPQVTPQATAVPDQSVLEPMLGNEPPPSPTVSPAEAWSYDQQGILRVTEAGYTYPAAILTWLSAKTGQKLAGEDLAQLRTLTVPQVAALQMTAGRAPLFLREARLPTNLDYIADDQMPALVQVDDDAPGFGPWSVVTLRGKENIVLLDPRRGRVEVPVELLDQHITGVVVPFRDPEGLVGLRPLAEGDAVRALQKRLKAAGLYMKDPSGVFDPLTEASVKRYREVVEMPGANEIDAALALRLITDTAEDPAK